MDWSGRHVLVTGATGFVGSRVAARLLQEGARVRCLVRRPPAPDLERLGAGVVRGDLTDPATLAPALSGVSAIVHAAAVLSTSQEGAALETAGPINAGGTRHLAEAALAAGCRLFIHISTVAVYDARGLSEVDEQSPLWAGSRNPYNQTKADAERAVWEASARGLPVVVLRPPAVLGAHPTSRWCVRAIRRLAAGEEPWHPESNFGWVHAENLVDALLLAAAHPGSVGEAYNVVDGHVPAGEYYGRLARRLGLPEEPPAHLMPPAPWQGTWKAEKIRALGYQPRLGFADAMAEIERFAVEVGLLPPVR
jgi:nucleoside-diphosphate-sugar epimerase